MEQTKNLKIAHVVCVFPPYQGGIGNSAFNFACQSLAAGHKVEIFTPDYFQKDYSKLKNEIKINRIKPLFSKGNAAFIPKFFSLIKNFDIIHLHYPFFGGAEAVVLRRLFDPGQKLIVHYHMDSRSDGAKGIFFNIYRYLFLPIVLRVADKITCASFDYIEHSDISKYYFGHKTKFCEIPFGIDTDKFTPGPEKKSGNKVLFVAALDQAHYFKGLEVLFQALKIIKDNWMNPDISLDVVGDGDLRKYYLELALKFGVSEMVSFAGQVSQFELIKYYQAANVFVLPSINRGEAFGLVLVEAMSCGTPVVASDLPGVRRVFADREQGLVCPVNNPEKLAEKICEILDYPDRAKGMGQAARKLSKENYDWRVIGRKLNQEYENLLDK